VLNKVKGWLASVAAAIAAFAKKNPAAVSYVMSMAVAALAHYGLHVTPTELAGLLAVLLTATHGWLHVATRKQS
jgi:hypothetical protein